MTSRTDRIPRAAMSITDMFEMGDDYKKASDSERDFLASKRSVADEIIAKKASSTLSEVGGPLKQVSTNSSYSPKV